MVEMVGIIQYNELEEKLNTKTEELILNALYKHLEVSEYEYLEKQMLFAFSGIFKEVEEFFNFKYEIVKIGVINEKTNIELLIDFLNSCFNTNFKDIDEFFTERFLLLSSKEERLNIICCLFISLYNNEELNYELLENFGFNEKIYNSSVNYKHFINFSYEIACKNEQALYTYII
ncbi:MAG: hypothetical protein ACI4VH_02970 [Clostridia bacterium]